MRGALETHLIDAVRKQPVLYDRLAVGYNCKEDVDGAWKEVTEEVAEHIKNVNVTQCKLRWRTLRDRFVKQFAKTPDGVEHILPAARKWEYTNQMSFLSRHLKKRKYEEISPKIKGEQPSLCKRIFSRPLKRQSTINYNTDNSIPDGNISEDDSLPLISEYEPQESEFEPEIEIPTSRAKRPKIESIEFPIEAFEIEQLNADAAQQIPTVQVNINEATLNNLLNTTNELLQQQIKHNQQKSPNEAYLRVLDEYFLKLSPYELDKVKVEILNLILMKKQNAAAKKL